MSNAPAPARSAAAAETAIATRLPNAPVDMRPSRSSPRRHAIPCLTWSVPRARGRNRVLRGSGAPLSASVGTGLRVGVVPALAPGNPELTESLKEGGRGATTGLRRNRLRNGLVVAQVALALVLLVGAGLLMKSCARLQNVDPGFVPHHVLNMELSLPAQK